MGMMQKLGGRKFLLIIGMVLIAVALELKAPNGLTPTMAGFLTAIAGLFCAGNVAAQASYMKSQAESSPLQDKVDDLHDMVKTGMSPEAVQELGTLLANINSGLNDLKVATAQTGQAVLNLRQR